jgi:hypothetical protein
MSDEQRRMRRTTGCRDNSGVSFRDVTDMRICYSVKHRSFQKELRIPNVPMSRVLRNWLHLKVDSL